jgi:DNA-binding NarL/FixJ family response regulator
MQLPHVATLRGDSGVRAPRARPTRPPFEQTTAFPGDTIWRAALDSGAGSASPGDLPLAWDDLARGHLKVCCESTGRDRVYVIGRIDGPCRCLEPSETALVARLLCGESQKALAFELGLAPSTVSGHVIRALVKLGLSGGMVALPIVLAAQSWRLGSRISDTRSTPFEHEGCVYRVLSVPRPKTLRAPGLTCAEREIAHLLLEGLSRSEIACRRAASVNTVARQVSSIFSALNVTGRYALIRAAVDLGCFE